LAAVEDEIAALRASRDPVVRGHGYRVRNRDFHALVHEMAGSPIMAATARRMWDLSDFLINTAGPAAGAAPLSAALDQRHADHLRILAALRAGNGPTARRETEAHIVGTIALIRAAERGGPA
jgi:DNA-binding GntR family transcriptional regulator